MYACQTFSFVVTYAESSPTSTKKTIAYRTKKYFYQRMVEHMVSRNKKPASDKTFFQLLKKRFPGIRFVKVVHYLFCFLRCIPAVEYCLPLLYVVVLVFFRIFAVYKLGEFPI